MTDRLARRLGTLDAIAIGLGAMIGAGVFVAFGPATRAAGSNVLYALVIAGAIALCNAMSSARLAAKYPASGGTYIYARERLGHFWGFLAGWVFVIGKLASCAAIALTFGIYLEAEYARPLAAAAVIALVTVNYFGVKKTLAVTKVLVAVLLVLLGIVLVTASSPNEWALARAPIEPGGVAGTLQAAGFLFFAFAGYARIATLGEEVERPERTIPRAIPIALAIALAIYTAVCLQLLANVDVEIVAGSPAPLALIADIGVVGAGAAIAALGSLHALIAGVSRTAFAMAANRDLPHDLAAVHPRYHVPHRADIAVGIIVAIAVLVADLRDAIGFSSFAVLLYYALANASALTLRRGERHWSTRIFAGAGLAGCVVISVSLPLRSTLAGAALAAAGALVYVLKAWRSYPRSDPRR
ncbi:MAG: APC family permease [Kofleriaceae bacterium]